MPGPQWGADAHVSQSCVGLGLRGLSIWTIRGMWATEWSEEGVGRALPRARQSENYRHPEQVMDRQPARPEEHDSELRPLQWTRDRCRDQAKATRGDDRDRWVGKRVPPQAPALSVS